MKKLEKQIQAAIITWLRKHYFAIKYVGGQGGTPDIISCVNGVFVAFEVKRDNKSPISKLQEYQIQKINKLGGLAYVVRSLEEVKGIVANLPKKVVDVNGTI